jgi:hypothetical protein
MKTHTELADALAATGINGLAQATAALRRGEQSAALAATVDGYADAFARSGNYAAYAACADAADALRIDPNVVTGEFRAIRSSCIGGVACVEYEADDTARYVAMSRGRDEPPELIRVVSTDPDEAGLDDWHGGR